VEATLKEVPAKYESRVSLGYGNFPVQQILPQARLAAEASRWPPGRESSGSIGICRW